MATSIVDYLNSLGRASDYNSRAQLAAQMGIANYSGTAAQNTQLLSMVQSANFGPPLAPKPVSPAPAQTLTTTSPASQYQPIGTTPTSQAQPLGTSSFNATSSNALVQNLRQQLQSGQISVAQAQAALASSLATQVLKGGEQYQAILPQLTSSLFSNLGQIKTPDGRMATVDASGNLAYTSTQVYNSSTSGAGSAGSSKSVTANGSAIGSPTMSSATPYGSPQTGYFANYSDATAAANGILSAQSATGSNQLTPQQQQANGGVYDIYTGKMLSDEISALPSTGNSTLDSLQAAFGGSLLSGIQSGAQVNPNLQITPDLVTQFLNEAHGSVDPYYQQQLTSEITNINAAVGTLASQYGTAQAGQQAQFQQGIDTERENAGGSGTAFSGGRGLTEQYALGSQNRALQNIDLQYGQAIGQQLRQGGADLGNGIPGLTGSASSFALPSLATQSSTLEGPRGGVISAGGLNLNYNPSAYTYGTIPGNYASSLVGQSNQYLNSYLQSGANNGARQFQNVNGVPTLM